MRRNRTAAPPAENGSGQTKRRARVRSEARQERRGQGRRFVLLLEEDGKGTQEAAELVAGGLCRKELERPQRAAERHGRAKEGRQRLQRRAGAGRRNAGRGADRRRGRNAEGKGGALCCWRRPGRANRRPPSWARAIVPGRIGAATESRQDGTTEPKKDAAPPAEKGSR